MLITLNERKDRHSVAGLLSRLIFVAAIDAIFVALKLHHVVKPWQNRSGQFQQTCSAISLSLKGQFFTLLHDLRAKTTAWIATKEKKLGGNVPLLNR